MCLSVTTLAVTYLVCMSLFVGFKDLYCVDFAEILGDIA